MQSALSEKWKNADVPKMKREKNFKKRK